MRGQFPTIICFKYFPRIKSFQSLIFNSAFCHVLALQDPGRQLTAPCYGHQVSLYIVRKNCHYWLWKEFCSARRRPSTGSDISTNQESSARVSGSSQFSPPSLWRSMRSTPTSRLSLGYGGISSEVARLRITFQQKPLTTIGDPTASLNEIYFPSVTVCNVNQVKKSLVEAANITRDSDINYLVSFFMTGDNLTEPVNWKQTLEMVQTKTSFDNAGPDKEKSFGKMFSQVTLDQ